MLTFLFVYREAKDHLALEEKWDLAEKP